MLQFRATLSKVQATPAKPDDEYQVLVRLQLDAHDPPIDMGLVGADVIVTLEAAPLPMLPMEELLEQAGRAIR